MSQISTAESVRNYLMAQEPLSILTLDELYQVIGSNKKDSIRAALYACTLGTPVSKKAKPKKYYAIRLDILLDESTKLSEEIIFTLPGIPRDLIENDASTEYVKQIKQNIINNHLLSKEVVDYWLRSAQYRSVDLIQKNMNKAKERGGGECVLCSKVNNLRQTKGLSALPKPMKIFACHIISRNSLFWKIIEEILNKGFNLFSKVGVEELKTNLLKNDYHSHDRFMIGLCKKHDKLLQTQLKK